MSAPLRVQRRQLRAMGCGALICGALGPGLGVAVMELEPFFSTKPRDPQLVGYQIAFIPLVLIFAYLSVTIPGAVVGAFGGLLLDQFHRRSVISQLSGTVAGGLAAYIGIRFFEWAFAGRGQTTTPPDFIAAALISGAVCGLVLSFFVPAKFRPDHS